MHSTAIYNSPIDRGSAGVVNAGAERSLEPSHKHPNAHTQLCIPTLCELMHWSHSQERTGGTICLLAERNQCSTVTNYPYSTLLQHCNSSSSSSLIRRKGDKSLVSFRGDIFTFGPLHCGALMPKLLKNI